MYISKYVGVMCQHVKGVQSGKAIVLLKCVTLQYVAWSLLI